MRVHHCGIFTAASLNIVTVTGTDVIHHWTALNLKDVRGVRSGHTWGVVAVTDTVGDVRVQVSDVQSEGRDPGDCNEGITETSSFHFSWYVQFSCNKRKVNQCSQI